MTEPKNMICRTERLVISLGAILIHDGLKNPGQFNLPPDEMGFFTRLYRFKMDGEFINSWARFIYDKRTGWADVEFTWQDPLKKVGFRQGTERRRLHQVTETKEVFKSV